jgi:hypothetical protein
MRGAWALSTVGLGLGAGVLLASLGEDRLGTATPLLMAAALAAQAAGSAALFWRRRFAYGAAVLVGTAVLVQLSVMKWYGEHGVPTQTGWQTHRHTVWELGHVH